MRTEGHTLQIRPCKWHATIGAPDLGSAELRGWGSHRFVPISHCLSDLLSLSSGMPRFVPNCSDLFQFPPISFQSKLEQMRETPFFCRPLLQSPKTTTSHSSRLAFLRLYSDWHHHNQALSCAPHCVPRCWWGRGMHEERIRFPRSVSLLTYAHWLGF